MMSECVLYREFLHYFNLRSEDNLSKKDKVLGLLIQWFHEMYEHTHFVFSPAVTTFGKHKVFLCFPGRGECGR